MKYLLCFLGLLLPAMSQQVQISDTLTNAVGGGAWSGKITVTLNSPASASPLYYSTTSLAGWQYVLCVGVTGGECSATTAAGVISIPLFANSTITPAGTSYSARYQPTKGSPVTETWTVTASSTKLYEIRSTTVPSPTVTFQPPQLLLGAGYIPYGASTGYGTSLAPGTNGHVLTLSGGYPSWATPAACATCVVTSGSYADPAWITSLVGSKISGAVASATALGTTYAASAILFGAASGTPSSDASNLCFDNSTDRLGLGTCSPGSKFEISNTASIKGLQIVNSSSASAVAALNLYSNLVHTGTGGNALASFTLDNASSTGTALSVQNDGTGYAARILGAGGLQVSDGATCAQSTWLVHLCQGSNQTTFTMDAYGSENVILARTALGTSDAPLALSANQMMLNVAARGYTGSAFTTLSRVGMQYYASEAWTASAQGTFINWYVTTHGASASTSKMTLHNDGALVLGLTGSAPLALSGSGAKLQVTGLSEFIGTAQITDADLPYLRWYRNGTIKGYFAIGNGSSIAASAAAGDMVIRAEQTLRLRAGGDAGGASLDSSGNLTATTFTGALTGNASTATELASTVASGRLWVGQGTGVPTSDSVICADTTNHRLGVGTCSPSVALESSGILGVTGGAFSQPAGVGGIFFNFVSNTGNIIAVTSGTSGRQLNIGGYPLTFTSSQTAAELARFATTGNLIIGTTTDLGYGLHAANKGTNGNLLVFDPTATTGTSKFMVVAGQGQSGNITEWRAYNATPGSGTLLGYVASGGDARFVNLSTSAGDITVSSGSQFVASGSTKLYSPSNGVWVMWNAAQNDFSRLQFGGSSASYPALKRSTTILQARLADDSADTQLQASRFISAQTTPAASTDAGTAGAIWADATYIYVQTAAGTVKRIALTTF